MDRFPDARSSGSGASAPLPGKRLPANAERDLALCPGVVRGSADMVHALALEPFGQIAGDVAGAVVGEQSRLVPDLDAVAARCGERQLQLQRVGDVAGPHGRAKLPRHDVAREVVQDRAEMVPAPADDLQVGEVGLLSPGR